MMIIPQQLSNAKILITNDDGYDAKGIAILEKIARKFSNDIWVVAPKLEQSGVGHSITLHNPLRIKQIDKRKFTVSGTPTDCVLLAVREITHNMCNDPKPFDLVLSGINRGSNLADNVTYSGTIAAAMEACLLNIPAIAISQAVKDDEKHYSNKTHWESGEYYTEKIIEKLQGLTMPKGCFISVNVPNLPIDEIAGIASASQGRRKIIEKIEKRKDPKGQPYYWIGNEGFDSEDGNEQSDLELFRKKYVTVTPYNLDLTNYPMLMKIEEKIR